MSFFLYNQDGRQAIARPYLDGPPTPGRPGPSPLNDHSDMPKYHQQDTLRFHKSQGHYAVRWFVR